jgi:hypothetical protein
MRGRPLVSCRGSELLPHLPLWLRYGDRCPLCLVLGLADLDPTTKEVIVQQGHDMITRDELKEWAGEGV